MKNCPNCTRINEDKAKFCFNCGLNFGKHYNKSIGRKEYCENCGVNLATNAIFCIECGTKVENNQNLPIDDTKVENETVTLCIDVDEKKKKTKTKKISVNVGQTMQFGSYYLPEEMGKTPIEWVVLKNDGEKMFIVSKFILDCKQYNTKNSDVTWEVSTIRQWLNDDFYNDAFTSGEKRQILETSLENEDNPKHKSMGGNKTNDKVFLLSIDETQTFFQNDNVRKCKATEYALNNGAHGLIDYSSVWWLRSPGKDQRAAVVISNTGNLYLDGREVNAKNVGVRPAMWISL